MTSDELHQWQQRMGYSQREAYEALDISERQYRNYVYGVYPIPRTIELATRGLEYGARS